jgi:hypothetical protein
LIHSSVGVEIFYKIDGRFIPFNTCHIMPLNFSFILRSNDPLIIAYSFSLASCKQLYPKYIRCPSRLNNEYNKGRSRMIPFSSATKDHHTGFFPKPLSVKCSMKLLLH